MLRCSPSCWQNLTCVTLTNTAAIMPAASLAAGKCCSTSLSYALMWGSHREGEAPGMPWMGHLSVPCPSTSDSYLSVSSWNSCTDAIRLKKVRPGFWSPPWWQTKLWDSREGDHLHAHHTLHFLPTLLQLERNQMLHLFQCWKWFMLPWATFSPKLNLASSWHAQSQFSCRGVCFDGKCCCLWNTVLRKKEGNSPPKEDKSSSISWMMTCPAGQLAWSLVPFYFSQVISLQGVKID